MADELEAEWEARLVQYAALHGYWSKKLNAPDRTGDPDRLFLRGGIHIFLECKRRGKEPTTKQHRRMADIRQHGGTAEWCDDISDACVILSLPVIA